MPRLIATIVGARPQFVKAGAVSRHLARAHGLRELVIHTGQHYDDNMSRVFFEDLDLSPPDYNLSIGSGTHGAQTGRMLEAIEKVLLDVQPCCVLVYGDTNSTLAGALAAAKLHIPVAHVEAGLRSYNRRMPEEINRVVTDHVSDLLFVPTAAAIRNLEVEGISSSKMHQTGDVMYDMAVLSARRAEERSTILRDLGLCRGEYFLATLHRPDNVDRPDTLKILFEGLVRISATFPVIWPVHPRTRPQLAAIGAHLGGSDRVRLIDPVRYLDMVILEKNARVIVTDSGGVQKEAFFYRVPCVTLRDETEWVELVELGWNRLCPPMSSDAIHEAVLGSVDYRGQEATLYGTADAGARIAGILADTYTAGPDNASRV
jgi:UDP-GlcNAc3NAcA epimerase